MDLLCAAGALSRSEEIDSDDTNSDDAEYTAFDPHAMKLIRYQTIEDLETEMGCYKHVKAHDGSFKIEIKSRFSLKGRLRVFSKAGFATAKDAATALITMIDKKREKMETELPEWLMMTPADKVPPPPSTWQWPSEGDTIKVQHDCGCCKQTEVDAIVKGVCSNGWFSAIIHCQQESAGGYIDWFKWNDIDWRYATALCGSKQV